MAEAKKPRAAKAKAPRAPAEKAGEVIREAVQRAVDDPANDLKGFLPAQKLKEKEAPQPADLSVFVTPSMATKAGVSLGAAKHHVRTHFNRDYYADMERVEARKRGTLIVVGALYGNHVKGRSKRGWTTLADSGQPAAAAPVAAATA